MRGHARCLELCAGSSDALTLAAMGVRVCRDYVVTGSAQHACIAIAVCGRLVLLCRWCSHRPDGAPVCETVPDLSRHAVQKRLGGKPGDSLFELVKDRRVPEDVVKVMRDEILGFSTFLVREVERPIVWQGRDIAGAVMLRGNARKDARAVATALQDGLDSRCGPFPCRLLCFPEAL